MARWEPDGRQRLVLAALDLFAEQGYDATTVAEIAAKAGLTKSTFFRHFSDKREVLVAGQETLSRLLSEGIEAASPDAGPLEAVADGLRRVSDAMTPFNREIGPRLHAVVAANRELQERNALKSVGMAEAMADALRQRGTGDVAARLAAELGVLAFKVGYGRWTDPARDEDPGELATHMLAALEELRAASAELH